MSFLGNDRVEVRYDVLAAFLAELAHSLISHPPFAIRHFDQKRITSPKHVGYDARRSDKLGWVVFVEAEFGIACPDIEDSYLSHLISSLVSSNPA